jgi:hypothetical protein
MAQAGREGLLRLSRRADEHRGTRCISGSRDAQALRRRSQRDKTTWQRCTKIADEWLPKPKSLHPWPSDRFAVKHPRWEPWTSLAHDRWRDEMSLDEVVAARSTHAGGSGILRGPLPSYTAASTPATMRCRRSCANSRNSFAMPRPRSLIVSMEWTACRPRARVPLQ